MPLRIRRTLWACAAIVGALALYALSFGPVLRFCGAKPSAGWSSLPPTVLIIYSPLAYVPEPVATVLDRYVQWWMGGK